MANKEKEMGDAAEGALKELRRDLGREIDEIRTTIREKGPAAAQESLENVRAEFDKRSSEIRDSFLGSVETSKKMIQERPLIAVGAALAVGVLIGVLLSRKSNE